MHRQATITGHQAHELTLLPEATDPSLCGELAIHVMQSKPLIESNGKVPFNKK
jgi:hypothetical protein